MARLYAKLAGPFLLLTGLGGLVFGDQQLFGVLNIDIVEDLVHLVTGGLLIAVGFASAGKTAAIVTALVGIAYLGLGVSGFVEPALWGLVPSGYTVFDNVLHLVLGAIAGLAVVSDLRSPRPDAGPSVMSI